MAKTTLNEQAQRLEGMIPGAVAYLLVVLPTGGGMIDRVHPNGDVSSVAFGALTPEGQALSEIAGQVRSGSSYAGEW